jgi:hypothetical protein
MYGAFMPVVVHTKAVVEALGVEAGLELLAEAGVTQVVIWAGESGEHLDSITVATKLGFEVVSVAIPKFKAVSDIWMADAWIARCAEQGARAASVIFSDRATVELSAAERDRLCLRLGSFGIPLWIENNGRTEERFCDPGEIARLLVQVPSTRYILDIGHLLSSGSLRGLDGIAMDRVASVDLHDNDGIRDLHLPLGTGTAEGCSLPVFDRLQVLPEHVVIETDARLGTDWDGWLASTRRDLALVDDGLGRRAAVVRETA